MLIYMFFHIFMGLVNIGVVDGIYEKLKREKNSGVYVLAFVLGPFIFGLFLVALVSWFVEYKMLSDD